MMFRVTNRRTHEAWLVKAAGHQEAAQIAGGKRGKHGITMVRVTGEDGTSGTYQGYSETPGGGRSSTGDEYRVTDETLT
jgi:hypothetical protein